jgi:hypothetical protein
MTRVLIPWSDRELAIIKEGAEAGESPRKIRDRLSAEGFARTVPAVEHQREREAWRPMVRPSPYPRFDQPLEIEGDALLLFDIHAPFHDAAWLNRVIALALKWGIRQVGIGGDLIDLAAWSCWGHDAEVLAEEEIRATEQIINTLAANFDSIAYVGGNHEERLSRQLGCLMGLARIMAIWVAAEKVRVSDYHWFRVVSGGETFYCEHPKNASINATIVPKQLAAKLQCHVVAGHGHLFGMARDVSGRYWAIDSGICADPLRLDYTTKIHNTRPTMQQGAVIIRQGVPVLLSPGNIAFYEVCKL